MEVDSRKPFRQKEKELSDARLAVVRPLLEKYAQKFCHLRLFPLENTSLRFGPDVRVFKNEQILGHLEDEVRTDGWLGTCKGCVDPKGPFRSVHVPNRPNKTAHADFYVQYHQVTPFFWIAPMNVVRSWSLTTLQACNNDEPERFLDGANDAVDWYRITENGILTHSPNLQRFELWLDKQI